ncbi:hypothetical protein WEI85_15500 [Actinomycetes bacterium KLBMP 9797]
MTDDRAEIDELTDQIADAYAAFRRETYAATQSWGYWTGTGRRLLGPFNAAQVAGIYRLILAALFALGVVFTVVSDATTEMGMALIVGALFAFGAWMAQAWALSREEESRIEEKLLGDLLHRDLKRQADHIAELTRRLDELHDQQP